MMGLGVLAAADKFDHMDDNEVRPLWEGNYEKTKRQFRIDENKKKIETVKSATDLSFHFHTVCAQLLA